MQSVIPPGDPNFPGVVFPSMTTAYKPTPEELEMLNNGGTIILQELGKPPITPRSIWVELMGDSDAINPNQPTNQLPS